MKLILKKYRTRICILIGLVFFIHYIYLLSKNLVIIKYDLVKYHLLRTGIEKKLSHFLKTPKNLEQNIKTLSDELKNPMSYSVVEIEFDDTTSDCQSDQVCHEYYLGNLADLPWHENAWIIDPNCTKPLAHLFSIVLIQDEFTEKVIKDIKSKYPMISIFVGVHELKLAKHYHTQNDNPIFVTLLAKNFRETDHWIQLLKLVKTKYVLIGYKMHKLQNYFGNFERMLRLIDASNTTNRVVTGATKNASGHWRSHCWQTKVKSYNLILTPGYRTSQCDCMSCNLFWDNFGPFLAFTEDILVGLDSNLTNPMLMFANFFLKLSQGGYNLLSCPDVLFHTGSDRMLPNRQEWIEMAQKMQVQAISIDIGPLKVEEFTCQEIGKKQASN